jgi:uncharacterized protein YndB with AHSA1/START domain
MTNDHRPATRMLSSLRRLDEVKGAVREEDVYDTDIADLWSALTDPRRLGRWIAIVEGDLRTGGHIQARFTSTWSGAGRIDICEPPRHLLVTMEPGTADETVIEAVLSSVEAQTRLVIEQRGLLLADLPGRGAGWQAHAEELAAYLSGRQPAPWRERWADLIPAYEALGQPAEGSGGPGAR